MQQSTLDLLNDTLMPGNFRTTNAFGPSYLEIGSGGQTIFVGSVSTNVYSRLNLTTGVVDRGANLPGYVEAAVVDPSTGDLYVAAGDFVVALNPALSETASYNLGTALAGVAVDPVTGDVFATEGQNATLVELGPQLSSVLATVQVGSNPAGVVYLPGPEAVAVAISGTDQITEVATDSMSIEKNVTVGNGPRDLYYDASDGDLYSSNQVAGNASIVNASTFALVAGFSFAWGWNSATRDPSTGQLFFSGQLNTKIAVVYEGNNSVGPYIQTPAAYGVPFATFDSSDGDLYVSNTTTNGVDLYSVSAARWVGHIGTAITPDAGIFDPTTDQVVVAGQASNNLTIIDSGSHRVVANIATALLPWQLALDPDNGTYYVTGGCSEGLAAVNASSYAVEGCVRVSPSASGIAWDARTHHLFVTNAGSTVYDVDPATGAVVNIPLPSSSAYGAYDAFDAYDPSTGDIYVSNGNWNNVTVINGSSDAIVGWVGVGLEPAALAYDPLTQEMLVTDSGGSYINRINGTTLTSTLSFHVGNSPWSLSVDAARDVLYIGFAGAGNVSVWRASTYSYLGAVPTGDGVRGIVSDPDSGVTFTANWEGDNVTVVDGTNLTDLGSISVGQGPIGVAWDSLTGSILVTNGANGFSGSPGGGSISILKVTLNSLPSITSFFATPSRVTLGDPVNFTASATSGVGSLTFSYSGLPAGCAGPNLSRFSCVPQSPGRFDVALTVSDQGGHSTTQSLLLTVAIYLSVRSASAAHNPTDEHLRTNLTVDANPGVGPLSYVWLFLPGGCGSSNVSVLRCAPSNTGTFRIYVEITDAVSDSVSAQLNLTVVSPVSIGNFAVSSPSVNTTDPLTMTVYASGGVGALSYSYSGMPPGCTSQNSSSVTCHPTQAGSYQVESIVTDSLGQSVNATVNITVTQKNASPGLPIIGGGPTTGGSTLIWILAGAAIIAAVVGGALLYRRRGRTPGALDHAAPGSEPPPTP